MTKSPAWLRLQNLIAERALRRGRKWTASEQLENLKAGLREIDLDEPDTESASQSEGQR